MPQPSTCTKAGWSSSLQQSVYHSPTTDTSYLAVQEGGSGSSLQPEGSSLSALLASTGLLTGSSQSLGEDFGSLLRESSVDK